jgi:hypothetical protein
LLSSLLRANPKKPIRGNLTAAMDADVVNILRKEFTHSFKRLLGKGWPTEEAARAARALSAFAYFTPDFWRLEVIPDETPYDDSYIDDPNEKKEVRQRIRDEGVFGIKTEWRFSIFDDWEEADSVWGFIGDDWKDSGYDTDMMRSAMREFIDATKPEKLEPDQQVVRIVALYGTRTDEEAVAADKQGRFLLDTLPLPPAIDPSQTVPGMPAHVLPHFYSKHTFQIRRDVYAGWNVLRFEQSPSGPWHWEKMTSQLEPREEAINVAKSYADDLANRMKPNPNAVRVLDEFGNCIYAVMKTDKGVTPVNCPQSIINPRQRRHANPISRNAEIALAAGGAVALGVVAYFIFRPKAAPPPLNLPTKMIQGHRYQSVVTMPSNLQPSVDISTPEKAQAFLDSHKVPMKVVSISRTNINPQTAQLTVVFDYTGPTQDFANEVTPQMQQQAAQQGVQVTVTDLGPYKTAGVAGFYPAHEVSPNFMYRILLPG